MIYTKDYFFLYFHNWTLLLMTVCMVMLLTDSGNKLNVEINLETLEWLKSWMVPAILDMGIHTINYQWENTYKDMPIEELFH